MSNLLLFSYNDQQVRTVEIDGEPWLVIADVCKVLGLSNPTMAAQSLDEDDLSTTEVIDALGRKQQVRTTNESGVYQLIFQSRKPEAKQFKRWVTHEVIPQIRETGRYNAPVLTGPELMARALIEATATIEKADALVLELKPKAEAFDALVSSTGDYSINETAKILSRDDSILTGEGRLRDKLMSWRWMYRDNRGKPRAMQSQVDCGRLVEKAQFHFHPGSGEKILDAPQVRVTAHGLTAIRTRLLNELKAAA